MNRICWAISDGAAGNERQTLALAHAMGLAPRVLRISFAQPWAALAPHLSVGALHAVRSDDGTAINAPWPEIAIGCGRSAALLTRRLRVLGAGQCFTVQILDPRIDTAHFDVVVAPRHDQLHGANVIETIGSLHPIDEAWLSAARDRFAQFASLPGPRTAILIGASNRAQALDAAYFDALLTRLATLHARSPGSFLVSTSRRTPRDLVAHLRQEFSRWPGYFWGDASDGENPYAGMLGWADRILVTPDSVNMLSEACASGKPVHTFTTQPLRGKLALFHGALRAQGQLRPFDTMPSTQETTALLETATVAARIREIWQMQRSSAD